MRFSIRDLMFVMLLVAVCLLWWRDRTALNARNDDMAVQVQKVTAEAAAARQYMQVLEASRQARRAAAQAELDIFQGSKYEAELIPNNLLHSDDPDFNLGQHLGRPAPAQKRTGRGKTAGGLSPFE
jgi:hypothetical protein